MLHAIFGTYLEKLFVSNNSILSSNSTCEDLGNYINDFRSMDSQALTHPESREIAPKEQCSW